jgi:hypothetical protein
VRQCLAANQTETATRRRITGDEKAKALQQNEPKEPHLLEILPATMTAPSEPSSKHTPTLLSMLSQKLRHMPRHPPSVNVPVRAHAPTNPSADLPMTLILAITTKTMAAVQDETEG